VFSALAAAGLPDHARRCIAATRFLAHRRRTPARRGTADTGQSGSDSPAAASRSLGRCSRLHRKAPFVTSDGRLAQLAPGRLPSPPLVQPQRSAFRQGAGGCMAPLTPPTRRIMPAQSVLYHDTACSAPRQRLASAQASASTRLLS
jgi:hypothetical protein